MDLSLIFFRFPAEQLNLWQLGTSSQHAYLLNPTMSLRGFGFHPPGQVNFAHISTSSQHVSRSFPSMFLYDGSTCHPSPLHMSRLQ
jgi:hypothetical protein